jgi:hypothetical protein
MKKIMIIIAVLTFSAAMLCGAENTGEQQTVTQPGEAAAQETQTPAGHKKFFWGFAIGMGLEQPIIPDALSNAVYNAKAAPMFAFDIGANISFYFNKWLGITASVGYTYMPFKLKGEGTASMGAIPITPTIPGMPALSTNSYTTFTGYLKGIMHYLFIKVGPAFKISDFYINLEAILIIHLSSTYKLDLGNITNSTLGLVKMPEMSGDYKEARAAAFGIVLSPGYRFNIGKGLHLPVGLEFCIMLTPIASTNIAGYNLPDATIKTWYLKLKVGLEF